MSPAALDRLKTVAMFVSNQLMAGATVDTVINRLIVDHGATRSISGGAYTLRAGGVVGSCTWSRDKGLLDSWRKNATVKIMREQMA